MKKSFKIYIDTNIISIIKDNNIELKELNAITLMTNNQLVEVYTSEKTKREIDKHGDKIRRNKLNFVYNLINKIPEENILKTELGGVGVDLIGVSPIGSGAYQALDPLLVRLRNIFDIDDAEHIFQAVKNNLDFFITLDKKSILNRVKENKKKINGIGISIGFALPSQFVKKINLD